MQRNLQFFALSLTLLLTATAAQSQIENIPKSWDIPEEPKWQEAEIKLPEFPKPENLVPFDVLPTTGTRYLIDASTLNVGKDGIVRYVLVIKASGGATNITYEGMRCNTVEYKLYATGRANGTWAIAKTRSDEWRPIQNKANSHHMAINKDYFCPKSDAIANADEGRDALRRGRNPRAE